MNHHRARKTDPKDCDPVDVFSAGANPDIPHTPISRQFFHLFELLHESGLH
jgi:hypothetical protein